jgi:hypothetical protein
MSAFADHFSRTAAAYAVFRPHYPAALFDWLASVAPNRERAWDCATGSGQAAIGLAERFAHVVATDPSTAQLAHAVRDARVSYVAMTAERAALASRSVALVTVAQALHWIDQAAFHEEARRTLVAGGVVAVWSYALGAFGDPGIDGAIGQFYRGTVGAYWPPERAEVDEGYARIDFPFDELVPPPLSMEADWAFGQLAGYLSTWSAVRRARDATGIDPLPEFLARLEPLWGDPSAVRTIRWPLAIRVGRVR